MEGSPFGASPSRPAEGRGFAGFSHKRRFTTGMAVTPPALREGLSPPQGRKAGFGKLDDEEEDEASFLSSHGAPTSTPRAPPSGALPAEQNNSNLVEFNVTVKKAIDAEMYALMQKAVDAAVPSTAAAAPPAKASANKASLSAPQVAPYAMDGAAASK